MTQPDLFTHAPRFDGSDYQVERDTERLSRQMDDIRTLMVDGRWRTLGDIGALTGHPEASISAQLRHLRKPRFGAWTVEKRYVANGLYAYRVTR